MEEMKGWEGRKEERALKPKTTGNDYYLFPMNCYAINLLLEMHRHIRGCIQKFPDWPPGAKTANGTALCH
jgi:hypothetical protein